MVSSGSRDSAFITLRRVRLAARLSALAQTAGRGRLELALFGALYALYDAARWVFAGRPVVAQTHARSVLHLERTLHVAIEGSVQRAFDWPVASWVLANVYLAAQLAVLPGVLVLLYHRSPAVYRQLRNTVVVAWLIAIPIFAIYPVAPPRLAGIGIRDTVSHQAAVALTGHSTMFYNPYAAVPSLHVGLAFAVGVAVAASSRRRWVGLLALAWGPLVTLAVVATGNHFVFDAVAGLFVTALAFGLGQGLARMPARVRIPARRRPHLGCPADAAVVGGLERAFAAQGGEDLAPEQVELLVHAGLGQAAEVDAEELPAVGSEQLDGAQHLLHDRGGAADGEAGPRVGGGEAPGPGQWAGSEVRIELP